MVDDMRDRGAFQDDQEKNGSNRHRLESSITAPTRNDGASSQHSPVSIHCRHAWL